MILTIDIGNTNIVMGCFHKDQLLFLERFSTEQDSTALEYATIIREMLDLHEIKPFQIKGGIISSVVPSVTNTLKEAAEKFTGARMLVVGPGIKTGIKLAVDDPAQQGSDLIVGAVAGVHSYPVPQIIIDMGTATTVSVINKDKAYIGKMILPGVAVSLNALSGKAAQLPYIPLEKPKRLIGSNTVDSMKSGILYGNAGAMDGLIDRINEELGEECTVVATGGLAGVITPLCRHEIILDDDLLLKGLLILYYKNCPA